MWKLGSIRSINHKGNQSRIFIGKTDAEAEAPVLWPPDGKSWHIGKDPDAGKDWGQEEKGTLEDEMVGWHHRHQWTWVWVNSGSWWWTGQPGVLRFMGLQRVGHDWATELNWTEYASLSCTLPSHFLSPKTLISENKQDIYCSLAHVPKALL